MFRSNVSSSAVQAVLFSAIAAAAVSTPAQSQILSTHSDSLTSYLAGGTKVQGVQPQHLMRGVGIDGSTRQGPVFSMAIAGNPFENAWTGHEHQGSLRLDIGAWSPTEVDIALPANGFVWPVARSFSSVQKSGGSFVDSDGPMGRNWAMSGSPEIVFYNDADNAKDVIYLVYGADRFVEFVRYNSSSSQFVGRNGAAGVFDYSSGSPDTYTLTDQVGTRFTFFGFNTTSNIHDGQLWKIVDTANNMAFVGHATAASTAISNGFDGSGRVLLAFDTSDRRYTYTYTSTSYGGKTRLQDVTVDAKTGGTWATTPLGVTEVAKVEYTYYGDESYGDSGDLKTVKLTMPLTDSGVSVVRKKLYRYWEGSADGTSAYHATTNPGYVHALKYIYESEGIRRYDWSVDSALDDDHLTASNDTLKSYAAAYFEYNSNHQVSKAWFQGQCGCGGAGDGTHEYTYESLGADDVASYEVEYRSRTLVKRPDQSYLTQYFDEVGQGRTSVISDVIPTSTSPTPKLWVTHVIRDSAGRVDTVHTPANVTAYDHSASPPSVTLSGGAGLVWKYARESSGNMTGFVLDRKFQEGTSSSLYLDHSSTWTSVSKTIGDTSVVRPLVASSRVYPTAVTSGPADSTLTSHAYTAYSADTGVENTNQALVPERVDTTIPTVDSANNGSGTSIVTKRLTHHRKDGLLDYARSETGVIGYRSYADGRLIQSREDANTGDLAEPTDFSSSGSPINKTTEFDYDIKGSPKIKTDYKGATTEQKPYTYRSRLADHRLVTLDFPNSVTSGSTTYYGPVRFSITNQAGKVEASGVLKLSSSGTTSAATSWVDETDADPITALDLAAVGQLSTSIYDETGVEFEESRAYFAIPSSGAGTDGTHYDPTKYGSDPMGRQWRVKEASGTISRTVFDAIGRRIESWIGTNDASFTGGESSGTDNMVKTDITVYDLGNDKANGLVTQRTLRVESTSTGERVTNYTYDLRGRLLLETNPTAPHAFHKYDNMGRRVATGLFSSTGSITALSDDPTTETTNRLALSQTFYDERGRVWKTQRHKIDDADGSDDDNLQTLTWYDEQGRVIKVDGSALTKTEYDGLGRATIEYTLAKDDDTAYTDVDDVIGDIVQQEVHTGYDGSKNDVILQVRVDRWHNDATHGDLTETTAELDENIDPHVVPAAASTSDDSGTTELLGRAQISASWYDSLGRITENVSLGTFNGSSFNRVGSALPSRSDAALRISYVYNDDGTLKSIEDAKALKTLFTYDALGRKLSEVKNWDGTSTPTPSGTDDNVTVRYEYVDGLRTKLIADLPSGQTDQETVYTFGTMKGTGAGDSKIATGHLPWKESYPDSANGTDLVTHAYNAQGQEVYKSDQAGNVFEMEFDLAGRQTQKRVTTLASGFDGAVRRITTAYDSFGRTSTITQHDAASGGSVVDEVKYTYDDWGDVEKFEQDKNSAVGASGSVDDYEVSYTYETKTSPGRNTIRKTTMTLPSGKVITYAYLNREGQYDNASSRLTAIKDGAVYLAEYMYNGVGQVVKTEYLEADVMWDLTDESDVFTSYPDLDRFNRVVTSKWTKDFPTPTPDIDFYGVALTYDRNSNISSADDSIHAGFDVAYSLDDVNRLTRAEEGTLGGGSISSRTRDQQWTLTHTGNWSRDKVDLNGDGDFIDTDEVDDTRGHNDVNELETRDTDSNASTNYTLAYDAAGNMTDDGKDYEYEYDALYRLRRVRKTSNQALVAEYRYNGLGYKIGAHEDTDADDDVDGSDLWYFDAFDERWRQVARFRESDSAPKEEFVHHQAGGDGRGGSSYIDLVVCRYKDADELWTDASDGTLEERLFYCQNWRADVSAIVGADGSLKEWVKYSAYGVPFGMPGGDTNSDGDCDAADVAQVQTWIGAPTYAVRGDIDLDADLDSTDVSLMQTLVIGTNCLSGQNVENRSGFGAGMRTVANVGYRNRALGATGQWTVRDPTAYSDSMNLREYVRGNPLALIDPLGLVSYCAFEKEFQFEAYGRTINAMCVWRTSYYCDSCAVTYQSCAVTDQNDTIDLPINVVDIGVLPPIMVTDLAVLAFTDSYCSLVPTYCSDYSVLPNWGPVLRRGVRPKLHYSTEAMAFGFVAVAGLGSQPVSFSMGSTAGTIEGNHCCRMCDERAPQTDLPGMPGSETGATGASTDVAEDVIRETRDVPGWPWTTDGGLHLVPQ